jgi:hypothetical protein
MPSCLHKNSSKTMDYGGWQQGNYMYNKSREMTDIRFDWPEYFN